MGGKTKARKQTLTEFFESTFRPLWIKQKQLDEKTDTSYSETLAHWRELTDDPILKDIDDMTTANFMSELAKLPGKKSGTTMANSSLAKHGRQLATLLKICGPRSQNNPQGQAILKEVPFVSIPKVRKEPPSSDWSITEIRSMYDAAANMTAPDITDISPSSWWAAFITTAYFTGLRVDALMRVEFGMIEGRIIKVPGRLSKGKKGINQYLHAEALEHIKTLRRPGRERIFDWPSWRTSKRMAYDTFDRLLDSAGIPANRRKKKFHGFRATHLTTILRVSSRHSLGEQLAQQSAGHSDGRIVLEHYLSGDLRADLLAEAIDKMPSPCGAAAAERERNQE